MFNIKFGAGAASRYGFGIPKQSKMLDRYSMSMYAWIFLVLCRGGKEESVWRIRNFFSDSDPQILFIFGFGFLEQNIYGQLFISSLLSICHALLTLIEKVFWIMLFFLFNCFNWKAVDDSETLLESVFSILIWSSKTVFFIRIWIGSTKLGREKEGSPVLQQIQFGVEAWVECVLRWRLWEVGTGFLKRNLSCWYKSWYLHIYSIHNAFLN
jgi:hypothetical protein